MRFNMESPVFRFLETLADFVLLNLIFLITCIPIVTTGAALSALFSVTMREAREEHGYIIHPYLKAFKENLISGICLTVLYIGIGVVFAFNLVFWMQSGTLFGNISLAILVLCTILYLISSFYVFALNARFENTLRQTIKNSVLIALTNPAQTAIIVLIFIAACTIMYVSPSFRAFLLIFGFAFLAYCISFPLVRVFKKYEA